MAKGGGGAWKVAYADFVTAMMALFMVLWILGSESEMLEHLQEYFRNPPSPWDRKSSKFLVDMGEYTGLRKEKVDTEGYFSEMDPTILKGVVENFYKMLKIDTEPGEIPPVEIVMTSDGLRLIIFDRKDTPMFEKDNAVLTDWGDFLIQNLAWLLSRHRFDVVIEAHTEPLEQPKPRVVGRDTYGPWDRSVDRANKVRRMLELYAGGEVGIHRVTGFGNKQPLAEADGVGRTHQRVTISLSFVDPKTNHIPKNESILEEI
ncbi:MAG: flagellar motor protein MotB [Puniceicoccaceae bacterium]